jgi:hypothetical protein
MFLVLKAFLAFSVELAFSCFFVVRVSEKVY